MHAKKKAQLKKKASIMSLIVRKLNVIIELGDGNSDNCGIVGEGKAVLSLCYSNILKHDRAP